MPWTGGRGNQPPYAISNSAQSRIQRVQAQRAQRRRFQLLQASPGEGGHSSGRTLLGTADAKTDTQQAFGAGGQLSERSVYGMWIH